MSKINGHLILKTVCDIILGRKRYMTGRQFMKLTFIIDTVIFLFLLLHGLLFTTILQSSLSSVSVNVWYRRLFALILFAIHLIRLSILYKALKLTKQPKILKTHLNYYSGLCWTQFIYYCMFGIYIYFYKYFIKRAWTLQTHFTAILMPLVFIFVGIGIWKVRYHIRRLDSPMMDKLRDHIQIIKTSQQSSIQNPLGKPTSPSVDVVIEVQKNNWDFEIPFHLLESHVISSLDIIVNDKDLIAEGMFGIVHKGMLISDGIQTEIVLKAAKNTENSDTFQMLFQEIKTIIHVGDHPNIIKCFGVTSDATLNYHFSIVNEYCHNGNLEDFLENQRDNFELNQRHKNSAGQADARVGCLLEFKHLFKFTSEICLGMEHLAAKKVIHGDLATRNVLLSNNLEVKITDFGMSRRLYNYQQYSNLQNEALLPWRWMAIEAIEDLKLSEKSDVWSYGVTIWEIFTLGDFPYDELDWTLHIPQRLRNGLRLQKPPWANEQMYEVMQNCWRVDSEQRPSFKELRCQIVILKQESQC